MKPADSENRSGKYFKNFLRLLASVGALMYYFVDPYFSGQNVVLSSFL